MAKIFYSLAGEGRGHATRVRALVEDLKSEHEVVLFAAGDAYPMLAGVYRGTGVRIVRIPCLRFQYSQHAISVVRTAKGVAKYLKHLPRIIKFLRGILRREQPDLVISDFEPALARAAKSMDVPFVSFDHQHFLTVSDLSSLPWALRCRAWGLGEMVKLFYDGQRETIVSSFFSPPLRRRLRNVTQVGVLMRPEILSARRETGDYLLVYLRREAPHQVLEAFRRSARRVKIYGLGERPAEGNLRFLPVSEQGFMRDLAACEAVVTTAGNQLVGEALFLGKPVMALPENNNFEQFINAHFLAQSRAGAWRRMDQFDSAALAAFMDRLDEYRAHIRPEELCGNAAALRAIRRHLPHGMPAVATV